MSLAFRYDAEANAAYIRLSSQDIEESEEVSAGIIFDYDANGHIVGIEVLNAREHLPSEMLKAA